jgi:hypothetical protein
LAKKLTKKKKKDYTTKRAALESCPIQAFFLKQAPFNQQTQKGMQFCLHADKCMTSGWGAYQFSLSTTCIAVGLPLSKGFPFKGIHCLCRLKITYIHVPTIKNPKTSVQEPCVFALVLQKKKPSYGNRAHHSLQQRTIWKS